MTELLDAALLLRRISPGNDEADALRLVEEAAAAEERAERARIDAPARASRRLAATRSPSVSVGTALDSDGNKYIARLQEAAVRGGGHWLVTGATGSGKSYLILGILLQMLRRQPSGVIVIDMKGELAGLMRDAVLPGLVASLPDYAAGELASRIAVIAPFDNAATPPFQILTREPSIPIEVQAHEVSASFGRTIGNDLGVLQQHVLRNALMLAIDVGLSMPDVAELLRNQELLRGALQRCTLPDVKSYFERQFMRERSGSVTGLLSRLDSLVMVPSLRRMLAAPGMVRFDRLLERTVTIIDLGGAPAGLSDLSKFFGQLLFGKLVRAIFTRQINNRTRPVAIVADEFQQLLMPEVARDFERVLTLARSQKVFLWAMFQQAAQVESASPALLRILRTNTNYQVLLRSDLDDARHLAHVLPVTGTVPKETNGFPDPRTPPAFMTVEEERRHLLERVPSLPDRIFWFWDRRAQHPAVLVQSPRLDIEASTAAAARLPPEVRLAIRNGVLALSNETIDEATAGRLRFREELARGRGASRERENPLDRESGGTTEEIPVPPSAGRAPNRGLGDAPLELREAEHGDNDAGDGGDAQTRSGNRSRRRRGVSLG